MFLADYITPRQTSINFEYILKRKETMASQMLQLTSSQLTSSQLVNSQLATSTSATMTGSEAEKKFYRLRQKFGKERRKVTQSQPRSGARANHTTYTSNWVLYNDLMFLADYITPRQMSTNFKQSILKRKKAMASQMLQLTSSQLTSSQLVNSQLATSTSATNPSACTSPLTSEESTDVILSLDCDYLDSESIIAENEKALSIADSMESSSSKSNSLTSQSNASTNVARGTVSAITPKKLTPPADTKKRKRQTSDEVDAIMQESSRNISSLANTLEIVLKEKITSAESQPKKTELPHAVENMMMMA